MLLTTHYMEEADRLCTRLAIIDGGHVVVEGRPAALKARGRRRHGGAAARAGRPRRGLAGCRAGSGDAAGGHDGDRAPDDGRTAEFCRLLEGMVPCEAVAAHPEGIMLSVPDANAPSPACCDGWTATGSTSPACR